MINELLQSKKESRIISLKLTNWEEVINGIVLDYNKDWILLKYNPVDFIIDGYKIVKIDKVEEYKIEENHSIVSLGIKLKGNNDIIEKVNLKTINSILKDLKKYDLISFQEDDETICTVGKIESVNNNVMILKSIDPDGKWDNEKSKIDINKISTIDFNTDYIISLILVNNYLKS